MIAITEVRRDQGAVWSEELISKHGFFQLVVVTYGRCLYRIGSDKLVADKGEFVLLPSAAGYYGVTIPTVTHDKYVISFTTYALPPLPFLESGELVRLRPRRAAQMSQRVKELHERWVKPTRYREPMCAGMLLELLALLQDEWDGRERGRAGSELAELMKSYVHNHYREKVTKQQLGEFVGRSPNHCATAFRAATGQTISDYVHWTRVKAAQSLLVESGMTVEEIAEYVGYADVSYFYRIFKQKLGQVPSAYTARRETWPK